MSTINYLTVRNTVLPVVNATRVNYSTLTGSTITGSAILTSAITVSTLNLQSTTISLGQSTNQTYNNFSNGSYAPPWITAKEALSGTNKTVMSANGLYQMIVGNATSGLYLSSDSGITWTALTGGLPTLTGSAYWSDGAISANGQYITLSIYGGSLWMSADYGRTFALTNQPTPNIWLPLNGNTTDLMGSSTVTTPGTVPGYVTLNYPGYTAQAVNLANTAGGTATRYIRGTWPGAANFTVSLWFNAQALTSVYQNIFSAYAGAFIITIANNNTLYAQIPSGGASGISNMGFTSALTVNTWYYVTVMYQTNGLCSFYVNNVLIGSVTNTQGVGSYTSSAFGIGSYDTSTSQAFNGFIDDLRITNSVSTYVPIPLLQPNIWLPFENSPVDLGPYSVPIVTPTIYLPFEGNVTASIGGITPVATGSVTYVSTSRDGIAGQAIRLTNTAGSGAAQYVRGAWTGSANFTLSGWFNAQAFSGFQTIFSAYSGNVWVMLQPGGQLYAGVPSGGAALYVTVGTTAVLSLNTWYYVALIFQTSGLCSLYVNNVLIGSIINTQGVGTLTTTQFGIGCNDHNTSNAFNGTVDDFRIHNSAIPYAPVSNTVVTGSLSYVPGVVGLNAVNLVNTVGGTAANFVRSAWTGAPNITVSGWFNASSFQTIGNVHMFFAYTGTFGVFFNSSQQIQYFIPNGGATAGSIIATSNKISLNTWYHLYCTFRTGGLCELYINGLLIGSATNTGGVGTLSTTQFAIGTVDNNTSGAFNGYVDDFRVYNAAIPIHVLFPQNYRALALSGTGQYALASAASGWVVGSSDLLRTWSKQAVNVGTQSDFIQPNMTGLAAATWTQNGVTWTASASTILSASYPAYNLFNNTLSSSSWAPSSITYGSSGNSSGQTTLIQGTIGTVTGDWAQIQSSVPLIIASYQFASGGTTGQLPKTYYIVGSNDGTTWFPIQRGEGGTVTTTAANTIVPGIIVVNSTSTQTFGSSTIATTAYSTTANAYSYFRIIGMSVYITSGAVLEIGEWIVNFARSSTQALSLNHTGQYQLVATGPAAGSVMPNQTGLAPGSFPTISTSWIQNGVSWTASASSNNGSTQSANRAFNNTPGDAWLSDNTTQRYTAAGVTNGNTSTTSVIGVGPVIGEYLQLQSSVPLVMQSFALGLGLNPSPGNAPKTYYIIGSNDGTNWYTLQTGTTNITTLVGSSGYIIINQTGTQLLSGTSSGNIVTVAATTATNPYMYFRLIGTSLINGGGSTYMEIGEWFINFSNSVSYSSNYGSTWLNTSRTVSNESVALSPSGQYALSTNSVAPLARLTLDNTNVDAQGVLVPATVVGSSFSYDTNKVVGTHSINFANTAGATSSLTYLNYTVPATLYLQNILTMACWIYPIANPVSGNPCPMGFNNGSTSPGTLFQIVAGTNYINFSAWTTTGGSASISTTTAVTLNTWTHLVGTFLNGVLSFYVNGVLQGIANVTGSLSVLGGTNMTNLFIGAAYTTWGGFRGNVDDVRIYTSALSADEVSGLFRNPALTQTVAVSNSYLPITGYTEPILPGITANVVDTAVSQTGQYMVAVTSSTTNNVYYSTDFGATFTALTVGSLAMVSCSISYDGSYLTVTNATTTYTLNENTRGFALAIGNQAGRINQGLNAIAIGDKAGQTNQSNNSIVLNATGAALDAVAPGFYVAPIATAGSSSAAPFNLLGYGTDNQVVQSSALTVLQNGNMGISMANPVAPLHINQTLSFNSFYRTFGTASAMPAQLIIESPDIHRLYLGSYYTGGQGEVSVIQSSAYFSSTDHPGTLLLNPNGGNVGVGATNPGDSLTVTSPATIWASVGIIAPSAAVSAVTIYRPFGAGSSSNPQWLVGERFGAQGPFSIWAYDGSNHLGNAMTILGNGNLGLGVTNPGYRLALDADSAAKPATNTWTISSDERLKENITLADIDRCVEIIRAVPLKHYRWRDEVYTLEQVKDRSKLGWIAQDVERVFPKAIGTHVFRYNQVYDDVVKEDGTTEKQLVSEDVIEDCRDLNADQLYAVMYGAIQKLILENDAQKETNITLKTKNTELAQKLDTLSASHAALLAWAQTQGFAL